MWLLPAMVAGLVLPRRESDAWSIRPTGSESGERVRNTGKRPRSSTGACHQSADEAAQLLRGGATRDNLLPVFQLDQQATGIELHQLHHRIEIDDVRSVHLAEDFGIQTRGELAEAGMQQVALALGVNLRVIAARRDVLNLADVDRQDAFSSPGEE